MVRTFLSPGISSVKQVGITTIDWNTTDLVIAEIELRTPRK